MKISECNGCLYFLPRSQRIFDAFSNRVIKHWCLKYQCTPREVVICCFRIEKFQDTIKNSEETHAEKT
jgi:hypothetical protein